MNGLNKSQKIILKKKPFKNVDLFEIKNKFNEIKNNNGTNIVKNNKKGPYELITKNYNEYENLLKPEAKSNFIEMNWATQLREEKNNTSFRINKKMLLLKNKINKETKNKIEITKDFKQPSFYNEDLNKYKIKLKKFKRPLSSKVNPNFNNIKHLATNKLCLNDYEFELTLRTNKVKKLNLKNNDNINNKTWNHLPIHKNCKNLFSAFMIPNTDSGRKNYKQIEKYIVKPYKVAYKEEYLGNNKISKKVLIPKNDYSYSGIGNYLIMKPYSNKYKEPNTNIFQNILKNESNSTCLFEMNLRNYDGPNLKNKTDLNSKTKIKIKK